MSFSFTPQQGLVPVEVEVTGPAGGHVCHLVLDTGATRTLIATHILVALGYDPALAPARVQATTASGSGSLPLLPVQKVAALGHELFGFPVLCHTLPAAFTLDGLLGLDFFRGRVLTLDFQKGEISLT